MRGLLLLALTLQCVLGLLFAGVSASASAEEEPSFWDFVVKDGGGKSIPLHNFKGSRAILVVNVASQCGYTDQNYKELQVLYEMYNPSGLEILAFPCNQFGGQEPHPEAEILQFVKDQYQVSFPVLAKVDVNGKNTHPLFTYLKSKLTGFVTNDIKWNFTKFLLVDGVPTKRYGTTTTPFEIEADIKAALGISSDRNEL